MQFQMVARKGPSRNVELTKTTDGFRFVAHVLRLFPLVASITRQTKSPHGDIGCGENGRLSVTLGNIISAVERFR